MATNNPIKPAKKPSLTATNIQTRITSQALFNRQTAIYIEHASETYVLRITKQGKLILTK